MILNPAQSLVLSNLKRNKIWAELFLGLKALSYFHLTADKAMPCPYSCEQWHATRFPTKVPFCQVLKKNRKARGYFFAILAKK
ncbi:hypothetical protein [Hugenholtzia roseola]|uniref:hypothetical protein n=1 Tax=Hugenholtzia roseola TaxID=1002 RepID=UPI00047D1A08|nr:hypothetical protein [Hugenholtzia roseola]